MMYHHWVDLTSNTPSPISSIDTSNVPPPKSYTATVPGDFLSSPYGQVESAVVRLLYVLLLVLQFYLRLLLLVFVHH